MKRFLLLLGLSFLTFGNISNNVDFKNKECVAYAADFSSSSYDTSYTNEPLNDKQISTTYKLMNVDDTLDSYRGDGVKVAVIDSGLNYDHEDFLNNGKTIMTDVSKYYEYSSTSNQWLYYMPSKGWSSKLDDAYGHGTNVAATIAAQINGVGGYGLAPNVELYVYKVTNSSNAYLFNAINLAIRDAADLGVDIINMSFQSYEQKVTYNSSSMSASTGCSTVLTSAINYAYKKGVTLVAAAGNYNTNVLSYPAANNHVISVGSYTYDETKDEFTKAGYSNYGDVDLVAPGTVYVASNTSNSSYKTTSGTSFSAPLVTAAIALYKQKNPNATQQEIEDALYASCIEIDETNSTAKGWSGHGALDLYDFIMSDVENEEIKIGAFDDFISVGKEMKFESNHPSITSWSISDDSFGTIDNNGVFTPKKYGNVTVIATNTKNNTIFDKKDIHIYPKVVGIKNIVDSITLSLSDSINLDLMYILEDGSTYKVNNFSNIVFEVTDKNICSIDNNGKITAKSIGKTSVCVLDNYGNEIYINIEVKNSIINVSSVTIDNKISSSLYVGESITLTATILPNDATDKTIKWSSSNSDVATLDNNGLLTAIGKGSTTIFVETIDGGYKDSFELNVVEKDTPTPSQIGVWELVTSTDSLFDLDQVVIASKDDKVIAGQLSSKYLNSVACNSFNDDKTSITSLPEGALIFNVGKKSNNSICLSNNGKYLKGGSKTISFETNANYLDFSITNNNSILKTSNYSLQYNKSDPRFTFYGSNSKQQSIQLYRYVMSASEWCDYFIGQIGCDESGIKSPSVDGWNNSSKKYFGLKTSEQNILKNSDALEGDNSIENALYKYEYVVGKYGTNTYSNFINRNVKISANALLNEQMNNNVIFIIAFTSFISISSIICFIVVNRKKEEE